MEDLDAEHGSWWDKGSIISFLKRISKPFSVNVFTSTGMHLYQHVNKNLTNLFSELQIKY